MSFFKKKRFSDVEGYERISRLIEDRQRELTGEGEDDDALDEDTVLLSPRDRSSRDAVPDALSPYRQPDAREPRTSDTGSDPLSRQDVTAMLPQAIGAAPQRMRVPEIPALSSAVSLVSKEAVWEGKLTCKGDVRIEGTLEGELETAGTLFVVEGARVHGTVQARNVMLAGEIDGHLRCAERLEILPGGSALGEIDTGSLVVHEGAFIESRFQMRAPAASSARA